MRTASHRSTLAVALVAGLAPAALAQQANLDVTNIRALQTDKGLTGANIALGQMEPGDPLFTHASLVGALLNNQAGGTAADNHATHVAGIMLGRPTNFGGTNYVGVAPGSRLYKGVWDASGNLADGFVSGIKWMVREPAPIATNISAGLWPANAGLGNPAARPGNSTAAERARVAVWGDWGVNSRTDADGNARRRQLIVKSAGNRSDSGTTGPLTSPDGYNVLSVGATGRAVAGVPDYRKLDMYSSVGPMADGRTKPDIVAPGTLIASPDPQIVGPTGRYDRWTTAYQSNGTPVTGTSFAAPHVTGTIGLLGQAAANLNLAAEATDPMTLRAVLMTGASKNVQNRTDQRWEVSRPANTARADNTHPLDPQLGAGLLDAYRSYDILAAGKQEPFVYNLGINDWNTVSAKGWGFHNIGENMQVAYKTEKAIRKGSYFTSTLAWERDTRLNATTGEAEYVRPLSNLNLHLRDQDANGNLITESVSTVDSVEHILAKVPNRTHLMIDVRNASNQFDEFGVAWHGYEAPANVREFNGTFSGDRGALNDNGWFDSSSLLATSTVSQPGFVPAGDAAWAMQLIAPLPFTTARMAQEVVTPTQGFWLAFDAAFSADFTGMLRVTLGSLDLLNLAGFGGGAISPQAGTNVQQFAHYLVDLSNNPLTGLTGAFNDLRFEASGSLTGSAFVDNVSYVPEPGTVALAAMGLLTIARRRRSV